MIVSIFSAYSLITTKLLGVYLYFAAGGPCDGSKKFFDFPTWHKYLDHRTPEVGIVGEKVCSPHISNINDVWLIGLAVAEILLRVAVIIAIIYVMLGGMKYVNSRGNAEKTESAKKTVIDGLIGLIIAVSATAVISFIGGRFN